MNVPKTSLEAARMWCLHGSLLGPIRPPDETLTLAMSDSLAAELDTAAQQYHQAVADGTEQISFVVRDRRAPQERIVTGLRQRGVPLSRAPGIAPEEDPLVMELLQVTRALVTRAAGEEITDTTRSVLMDRLDPGTDIDAVLDEVSAAPTLVASLDRWIDQTDLVDRLMRADDGVYGHGHPGGTVAQHASAQHLTEIREVAHYLDSLRTADLPLPSFGPEELVAAIRESVMENRHPLFETSAASREESTDVELVEMAELKVSDVADTVIVLEATAGLFDTNPSEQQFALEPALGEHPDTPGVTVVTTDRAEQTFGPLPHISDGQRAWFVGLGRRYLGNALAAARDQAVICTRQDTDTRPSSTVIGLKQRLGLSFLSTDTIAGQGAGTTAGASDDDVQERIDRLRQCLRTETSATCDDATTLVEHLQADIRSGTLTDAQIGTVLQLLREYQQTTDEPEVPNP